ncbi:MAG: hypothetical protein NVS4B7_07550 [Ktedonobacteraceae bacterium]
MQEDEGQSEQEAQLPPENAVNENQSEAGMQPSPIAPVSLLLTQQQKRRQYLQGLGFGLIPLLLLLLGSGLVASNNSTSAPSFPLFLLSIVLYIVEFIITIVYLSREQRRFIGYGLLTAFVATPIVAAGGCLVIFNIRSRYP